MTWHSHRLNNHRRVWVYATGDDHSAERPLAILLDGQFWAESMPVWPALGPDRAGFIAACGLSAYRCD
jgi:enterochelin esterase family protein